MNHFRVLGHNSLLMAKKANNALHLTAIPLRSIAAGELGRWADDFGTNYI